MKPWAIFGLTHKLTETPPKWKFQAKSISTLFKKSLHFFVLDSGCSNRLLFEMDAVLSPQYNIHRFGIFSTQTPRHADLLIVLGKCNPSMEKPLFEAVNQVPEPYGILLLEEKNSIGKSLKDLGLPNVIGFFDEDLSADKIVSLLLNIKEGTL